MTLQSEFTRVPLDCIRYSLVWEDAATLAAALAVQPTDEVLIIGSAGCNALNTLLLGPRRVVALDLNPVQNHLLAFKAHLIRHHSHHTLRALLGLDGPAAVRAAWPTVAPHLPADMQAYWARFFEAHPAGLLTAGRLESYVTQFLPTLPETQQRHLRQLLHCATVAEQAAYFEQHLAGTDFPARFQAYFDDARLGQHGRDAHLFRYAAEAGGAAFYARLRRQLATELVRDNFFFRFFFFGPEHLPEAVLPPCYQRTRFAALRAALGKLTLAQSEAVAYLLSAAGRGITKASLSNIFEYVTAVEFERACQALFATGRPLRTVFWNLLQPHAETSAGGVPVAARLSEQLSARAGGCFYFHSVRVLDARLSLAEAHRHPRLLPAAVQPSALSPAL